MSDGNNVPVGIVPPAAAAAETPAIVPPAAEPLVRSITISLSEDGQYGVEHKGLGRDPVLLCGLLEVGKSIILDQLGPKRRLATELPGGAQLPPIQFQRPLPPGRYGGRPR